MPTPISDNTIETKMPLTFDFYDFYNENDRNLLYIDDSPKDILMNLEITNRLNQDVTLNKDQGESPPSLNNFHFELKFRPGELSELSLQQIDLGENSKPHWSMSRPVVDRNGEVFLYLLKKNNPLDISGLSTQDGKSNKTTITFKGIAANSINGVRGTNISIWYKNFYLKNDKNQPIENTYLLTLTILGRRGLRKAPLAITFAYTNSILNNGKPQAITIQISNIDKKENIALTPESKFIITIDADPAPDSDALATADNTVPDQTKKTSSSRREPWALAKKDDAGRIEIKIDDNKWNVLPNKNVEDPEWIITPTIDNSNLQPGQDVLIVLSNICTDLRAGHGDIYVEYQNLPGYTSDRVILGVKKTCLIESGGKIGIGTIKPKTALEVNGIITAESFNGMGVAVVGMIIMWYGDANTLPGGWVLCNGEQGTPNLIDRFVLGWDSSKNNIPKEQRKGGHNSIKLEEKHLPTHTVQGKTQGGSHYHSLAYYESDNYDRGRTKDTMWGSHFGQQNLSNPQVKTNDLKTTKVQESLSHEHTFTATYTATNQETIKIVPRYFGLYFIMYIGKEQRSVKKTETQV